jgi:hypothetical protein
MGPWEFAKATFFSRSSQFWGSEDRCMCPFHLQLKFKRIQVSPVCITTQEEKIQVVELTRDGLDRQHHIVPYK